MSYQVQGPFVSMYNEYHPYGGDALWLESTGRYSLCVGSRLNYVIPLLRTGYERFRDKAFDKALYKFTFFILFYFTLQTVEDPEPSERCFDFSADFWLNTTTHRNLF